MDSIRPVPNGRHWRFSVACHDHVSEALRLSAELLELADKQRDKCEHDGCMLLDGVVRDCAWKVRQAAVQWRHDLDEQINAGRGR
jgi:hypothetical protein